MSRYESVLQHATYRFDVDEEPPLVRVRFAIMKGSRLTFECYRTYDSREIDVIVEDFWSERPRINGLAVFLEPKRSLELKLVEGSS